MDCIRLNHIGAPFGAPYPLRTFWSDHHGCIIKSPQSRRLSGFPPLLLDELRGETLCGRRSRMTYGGQWGIPKTCIKTIKISWKIPWKFEMDDNWGYPYDFGNPWRLGPQKWWYLLWLRHQSSRRLMDDPMTWHWTTSWRLGIPMMKEASIPRCERNGAGICNPTCKPHMKIAKFCR